MKLSFKQIAQLHERMLDEDVKEIVLQENGDGKLRAFVPVEKLEQFSLTKRPRKAKPVYTP